MSESEEPTRREPEAPAGRARYERSFGGLVGAMLVTVLAVVVFAAIRAVTSDQEPIPVRAVDYSAEVTRARADKQLVVMAPEQLPLGWKATSATYRDGVSASWHLGTLTDDRKYVGVEEARVSIKDLVEEHVDTKADRGEDVTIGGEAWQTWTDAGGDYALARSLQDGEATVESVLVVGTAPEDEIREFAASLQDGR